MTTARIDKALAAHAVSRAVAVAAIAASAGGLALLIRLALLGEVRCKSR